jgi:hypothetical protein
MKHTFISFVAATAVAIGMLALTAQAQDATPQQQQVANGAGGIIYGISNGDSVNGALGSGNGLGTASASGKDNAGISVNLAGTGTADEHVGPTSGSAHSSSAVSGVVTAFGNPGTANPNTGSLNLEATQGSWLGLANDPSNYSNAGEITDGTVNLSTTSPGSLTLAGGADASGKTIVSLNSTDPNDASAKLKTYGQVSANVAPSSDCTKPQGNSSLSGTAIGNAGSLVQQDNSFSQAAIQGSSQMNATNPNPNTIGFVQVQGGTHTTINSAGTAATSTATIKAKAGLKH